LINEESSFCGSFKALVERAGFGISLPADHPAGHQKTSRKNYMLTAANWRWFFVFDTCDIIHSVMKFLEKMDIS